MKQADSGFFRLGIAFVLAIFLGLALVWVKNERVDLSYEHKILERELRKKQDQYSKLQIEREYLLAPATLGMRAEKAGLHPPRREQIRSIQ